jgi:hypothetical protein
LMSPYLSTFSSCCFFFFFLLFFSFKSTRSAGSYRARDNRRS